MTKQEYIDQRSRNVIDLRLAWEMYNNVSHPHPKVPGEIFQQLFPHYINLVNGDMTEYWNYHDKHFNVNQLIKQDGSVMFY